MDNPFKDSMAKSFCFGHSPVKGENSYTLLGWLLLYIIRQDKPHPIVLHKSTMSNLKNSIPADATLMLAFINRCALEKMYLQPLVLLAMTTLAPVHASGIIRYISLPLLLYDFRHRGYSSFMRLTKFVASLAIS